MLWFDWFCWLQWKRSSTFELHRFCGKTKVYCEFSVVILYRYFSRRTDAEPLDAIILRRILRFVEASGGFDNYLELVVNVFQSIDSF